MKPTPPWVVTQPLTANADMALAGTLRVAVRMTVPQPLDQRAVQEHVGGRIWLNLRARIAKISSIERSR
jgi:hypothetical protein